MRTYLVTFPDTATANTFLQRLQHHGAHCTWVAVDPNPTQENERQFTDEKSWDTLKGTVHQLINDEEAPDPGNPVWPTLPFEQWNIYQKQILITMAVTRWGYLGPSGPDPARVLDDYRHRRLPFQVTDPPAEDREFQYQTQENASC